MQMIADSLSKVGYLTLVLLIVLVIFAMAGMQTVGKEFYIEDKETVSFENFNLILYRYLTYFMFNDFFV